MVDNICKVCKTEFTSENYRTKLCATCKINNRKTSFNNWVEKHPKQRREIVNTWNANNRTKLKGYQLKRCYQLSINDIELKIQKQNNQCAICEKEFISSPHIDHDHGCCPGRTTCGKCIRGLLCKACNRGLGMFSDKEVLLEKALAYLKIYKDANETCKT